MRSSSIIYVAADDSKDLVTFAVQPSDSPVCTQVQTVPNEPRRLRRFLDRVAEAGPVRMCYEAGCAGFTLHRWVTAWGHQCDVVAPSLTPRRPGDRRKTDTRDARKLVGLYRAGELSFVHVPTAKEEQVRDLVRCREILQRECLRSRHYVVKLLTRYGEVFRGGRAWSARFERWLARVRLPGAAQDVLEEYVNLLAYQRDRREALDQRIAEVAAQPPYRLVVSRLRAFRGVDTQTAMVLVAETGNFRRFASPRALMSYYGLVPSEYSSGGTERRGAITKTGNARCRHVLIQAAWSYRHHPGLGAALKERQRGQPASVVAHAWKAQHRLYRRMQRLRQGKHLNVALTAVARELVGFLWAVLQEPPAVAAA